jgi:hypothetical protein
MKIKELPYDSCLNIAAGRGLSTPTLEHEMKVLTLSGGESFGSQYAFIQFLGSSL